MLRIEIVGARRQGGQAELLSKDGWVEVLLRKRRLYQLLLEGALIGSKHQPERLRIYRQRISNAMKPHIPAEGSLEDPQRLRH